jgi:hypothetical protein
MGKDAPALQAAMRRVWTGKTSLFMTYQAQEKADQQRAAVHMQPFYARVSALIRDCPFKLESTGEPLPEPDLSSPTYRVLVVKEHPNDVRVGQGSRQELVVSANPGGQITCRSVTTYLDRDGHMDRDDPMGAQNVSGFGENHTVDTAMAWLVDVSAHFLDPGTSPELLKPETAAVVQ